MKICKKCNVPFKTRQIIDGVSYVLSARVYCLECSPHKQHNTRHPDHVKLSGECEGCGRETSKRRALCTTCGSKYRKYRLKRRAVDLKGGKCEKCDWQGHLAGFQFHHIDPNDKVLEISGTRRWESIEAELNKCQLLCSNCHDILHATSDERFIRYAEKQGLDLGC